MFMHFHEHYKWHYKKPKAEIKLIQLKLGHIYKKKIKKLGAL